MSPVACILGFFDDLAVGVEVGLQRHWVAGRILLWWGWSKTLCFKLGRRMRAGAAASTPVDRMSTAVSPPDHHHPTVWVRRGGNFGLLGQDAWGTLAMGFLFPCGPKPQEGSTYAGERYPPAL